MAVCPKCSYSLVLLEHRNKYKCALCSRLFPQKEIDDKEFREWNTRQRVLDVEDYGQEMREKLAKIRELKMDMKHLFNGFPRRNDKKYMKEYYEKNKERIKQKIKEYCEKNKSRIKQKNKEYREKNKEYLQNKWREHYHKNREKLLEQDDKWREANQERISLTYKKWLERNKDKRKEFLKAYRTKNEGLEKQKLRLAYWRKKQENLADEHLKNDGYEACNISF